MQLQSYVAQVQAHLAAAAALGDERTRQTAEALAAAAEPAMRLAVLGAVSAASDEITAALLDAPGSPAVSVRMDGEELRVEVRTAAPETEASPAPPAPDADADTSARISLRLSEVLKSEIEAAAKTESVSVNTWLVRVASRALAHSRAAAGGPTWPGGAAGFAFDARGKNSAHRITGWVNG
jgi:uncharacterized protein (DUF1778 family)